MGALTVALVGTAALAGTPALAEGTCKQHLYGETCESEQQHAEFQAYVHCPFGASTALDCSWAQSTAKEMWPSKKVKEAYIEEHGKPLELPSEIQAGKVTVLLASPIILTGGINFENEAEEQWVGPNGVESIEPVAQKAQPLKKDVDTALLSSSELSRFDYYDKIARDTKVTATVELAGPASDIHVSVENLLEESGTAFSFPVKLKLSNQFLGSECYIGSNSSPIVVEFTTGTSGSVHGKDGSTLKADAAGITVPTDTLVNNTFASPGVEGCGVEGSADEAINAALGLPSPSGANLTVLDGTLKLNTAEAAQEGLEGKI
ncbi:MAG: hypothetical protein ACLQBB_00565 [Solirubrobacteraceae bacterium]